MRTNLERITSMAPVRRQFVAYKIFSRFLPALLPIPKRVGSFRCLYGGQFRLGQGDGKDKVHIHRGAAPLLFRCHIFLSNYQTFFFPCRICQPGMGLCWTVANLYRLPVRFWTECLLCWKRLPAMRMPMVCQARTHPTRLVFLSIVVRTFSKLECQ